METLAINRFLSELQNNGVRLSHQWRMQFTSPVSLELMTLYARSAKIPGVTQNTSEIKYYGYPLHVPTNFTMDQDLDLTVISDSQMILRQNMLDWIQMHSNFNVDKGGVGEGIKTAPDNGVTIRLDLLDNDMESIIDSIELVGAIPLNVGDYEVSHEKAEPIQFAVKFKYQYWKNVTMASQNGRTDTGIGGLLNRVAGIASGAKSLAQAFK